MAYARDTNVSIEQTKVDIERMLERCGATHFGYSTGPGEATINFQMHDRFVRYRLLLPNPKDKAFEYTGKKTFRRTPVQQRKAWEQACRSRWRALYLVIQAKLVAVEAGITSFADEFLAAFVLPSDRTVAEDLAAPIAEAYRTGKMPTAVPLLGHVVEGEVIE